jgi:hypothetical protein
MSFLSSSGAAEEKGSGADGPNLLWLPSMPPAATTCAPQNPLDGTTNRSALRTRQGSGHSWPGTPGTSRIAAASAGRSLQMRAASARCPLALLGRPAPRSRRRRLWLPAPWAAAQRPLPRGAAASRRPTAHRVRAHGDAAPASGAAKRGCPLVMPLPLTPSWSRPGSLGAAVIRSYPSTLTITSPSSPPPLCSIAPNTGAKAPQSKGALAPTCYMQSPAEHCQEHGRERGEGNQG